jgi:hypothetical protein
VATTLLQVPYGIIISTSILICVFVNDRLPPNSRCYMIVLFMIPNIAGAFGLMYVPEQYHMGRLICYYVCSLAPALDARADSDSTVDGAL